MPARPLLEVRDLTLQVDGPTGAAVVDRVSFQVEAGETVGLVGESGCGKSLTALALLRLLPPGVRLAGGQVLLDGEDVLGLPPGRLRQVRGGRIGLIFQEPLAALNPVLRIGTQVEEVVAAHRRLARRARRREAIRLLGEAGLPDPENMVRRHPHELSGGQGQRVLLALALAGEPDLLVADEATTALDVTVQAEILERIRELQAARGLAVLWIGHDLAVVAELCRRVLVMYAGRIVEAAPLARLFRSPRHPYTRGLLAAVPRPDAPGLPEGIPGTVPSARDYPQGCRFRGRCPVEGPECTVDPPWEEEGGGHAQACWHPLAPAAPEGGG